MTVLVSAAGGFLGERVVRRYLAMGRGVTALADETTDLDLLREAGAVPINRNLQQTFSKEEVASLKHIRIIVHCAELSARVGSKRMYQAANVEATKVLIDLAQKVNARRFIHISSPAVYWQPQDQFDLLESIELPEPVDPYAVSKLQAEEEVLSSLGRGTIILRPHGVYGAGDIEFFPRLLSAVRTGPLPLLRNGAAVTDITHVEDVVDAILAAERAGAISARIFNISGGHPVNVKELIDRIALEAGVRPRWKAAPLSIAMAKVRAAETRSALAGYRSPPRLTRADIGMLAFSQTHDISRAARNLGWTPRIDLEQGLREIFGDHASDPDLTEETEPLSDA